MTSRWRSGGDGCLNSHAIFGFVFLHAGSSVIALHIVAVRHTILNTLIDHKRKFPHLKYKMTFSSFDAFATGNSVRAIKSVPHQNGRPLVENCLPAVFAEPKKIASFSGYPLIRTQRHSFAKELTVNSKVFKRSVWV